MDELVKRGPGRPPKHIETPELPKRAARRPFGSMQQKLAYADRPGYHRHWFNDAKNRINDALGAGYEHVKDKEGKNVSHVVGTTEQGGPLTAFLMEIPQEWYDEDMAAQKAERDEKFASITSQERGYGRGISVTESVPAKAHQGPDR
jgi:hypothetical protein